MSTQRCTIFALELSVGREGFRVIRMFGTKAAAFHRMTKLKNQYWYEERSCGVDPLEIGWGEQWRIQPYEIDYP